MSDAAEDTWEQHLTPSQAAVMRLRFGITSTLAETAEALGLDDRLTARALEQAALTDLAGAGFRVCLVPGQRWRIARVRPGDATMCLGDPDDA